MISFWYVLSVYSKSWTSFLELINHFACFLSETNFLVAIHLESYSCCLSLVYIHNIGCINVAFLMYDAAILVCCARLCVLCQHIDAFYQDFTVFFVYGNYFALFVFIFSGDDLYSVAPF